MPLPNLKTYLCVVALQFCTVTLAAEEKPNIIMILADDVGFECFSAYGSREYSTPRLDALAAGGVRFKNCHSTPLCTPSRVNLMSGKSNVFNYFDFGVYPKGEPTFGNYFKEHGYATAVAGKWQLLTRKGGITPEEAGFDTYCLWNFPGGGSKRYWNPSLIQNGKRLDLPESSYGPDVTTDFLIRFMKANRDKPFLAYFPMILPHNPFLVTPDSVDPDSKNGKQNFVDMVQYIDKNVGRLEDTLKELGIREKTLIIFTGDNGTNSVLTSELNGRLIRGGKGYTHDYGTHVPLIINWPNKVRGGQVIDDLVCFSDLFPTMVDAAGLPPKKISEGDGWSFWPQCEGLPGRKREWIYCYYFPRPSSKKYDDKYSHYEVRFARDKRFKLYDNGDLFDTTLDVMEKHPLPIEKSGPDARSARKLLQKALDSYPSEGRNANRMRPSAPSRPMIWSGSRLPTTDEAEVLDGVKFHVIKKHEPHVDGYGFLHGVALAWHKGKLYASFGHNKGSENTRTEEGRYCVSDDGGKSWSEVKTIDTGLEEDDLAVSHGVFLSHGDTLWAFLGSFHGFRKRVHTRAYTLNEETGRWRAHGTVVKDGFWPMSEPVKMDDGNWIMPGFIVGRGNPAAVAISSGDDFTTWKTAIIPRGANVQNMWGESSIVVDGPHITNIARYGSKATALAASSNDYGRTWTHSNESNLPMAASKPCAGVLSNGQRYLICSTTKDGGNRRSPLTIAVSKPGKKVFSKLFVIRHAVFEDGPGESDSIAALSYPYATESNGNLYVGYSNNGPRRGNNNSAELAVIPIEKLAVK